MALFHKWPRKCALYSRVVTVGDTFYFTRLVQDASASTCDDIPGTVQSTLSYHRVAVLHDIKASRDSHMKYWESERIFKSDRPRIWPKFVLLRTRTLAFGLDSLWPRFFSNAFYAIPLHASCTSSVVRVKLCLRYQHD